MPTPKLIIIGASGHAKVIIDVFEQAASHEILGLLDDHVPKNSKVLGYPVMGTVADLSKHLSAHDQVEVFIAIGDNWVRSEVKARLMNDYSSLRWARAIHPFTHIGKDVSLGEGLAILAGAVINSEASVGDFAIIGSNANVDHESVLAEFVSLAPGSTIGGNVSISSFAAVGLGSNIINGCQIGSHTVIGAGSTVLNHFGDNLVVYGTPAREIRTRVPGEKYL